MSSAETRALRRAACALILLSFVRWVSLAGHARGQGPAQSSLDSLLQATTDAVDEEERRSAPLRPGERIDPNRATAVELDRLPGIGPSTAAAIVDFRASAGPFQVPSDLEGVPGLGPATTGRLAPFLNLDGPPFRGSLTRPPRGGRQIPGEAVLQTPRAVDVNRASASELEDLPGIGPALASRILEARRQRRFRRVEDLLGVPGIGPATLERLRPLVRAGPGE